MAEGIVQSLEILGTKCEKKAQICVLSLPQANVLSQTILDMY